MTNCDHNHSHDNHSHHNHNDNDKMRSGQLNTAFKISIFLNIFFVAVEIFYGYRSNSVSLLADAFHNLSDVFALAISLIGFIFSKRPNGKKISSGISIFNSLLLILTVVFLVSESWERVFKVEEINSNIVILVATIGIFINFSSAYLFKTHQHDNLNAEGAYLHLMSDAAISLGVVVSAIVIKYTGVFWLDPVISIIISLIILLSSFKLLKKSVQEYRACT